VGRLLGHREDGEQRQHEDRALQEQRRLVDDDGTARRHDLLVVHREQDHGDERRGEPQRAQHDLEEEALHARGERLDDDGENGDAEDDEHRRDRGVVHPRRREPRARRRVGRQQRPGAQLRPHSGAQAGLEQHHWFASSATSTAGSGSVTPTCSMVRLIAGLTTSSTGFG
jgi:hypothetical protein